MDNSIVIVEAKRTAIGCMQGAFSSLSAPQLGAEVLRQLVRGVGDDAALNEAEVIMGNVLSAGLGQAPARQAALQAGLPQSVLCTTINKMCGSGMKAIMQGHDQLIAQSASLVLAGGMESMTNAPYLLPKARAGYRLGHGQLIDHMMFDGLEDAYEPGKPMGYFADMAAKEFKVSRSEQDDFAIASLERARAAAQDGTFEREIVPIEISSRKLTQLIGMDEMPGRADPEKIPQLKPIFATDGTVTAANASSISDGAAAVLMMTAAEAQRRGLRPLARICAAATYANEPAWFTTAPVGAVRKLLDKCDWKTADVDLWEINEAFAVVTLIAMRELGLAHERVNISGGACALGHPIGASGARIVVTLLNALSRSGAKRGVATACIGGGEATALALELL